MNVSEKRQTEAETIQYLDGKEFILNVHHCVVDAFYRLPNEATPEASVVSELSSLFAVLR